MASTEHEPQISGEDALLVTSLAVSMIDDVLKETGLMARASALRKWQHLPRGLRPLRMYLAVAIEAAEACRPKDVSLGMYLVKEGRKLLKSLADAATGDTEFESAPIQAAGLLVLSTFGLALISAQDAGEQVTRDASEQILGFPKYIVDLATASIKHYEGDEAVHRKLIHSARKMYEYTAPLEDSELIAKDLFVMNPGAEA